MYCALQGPPTGGPLDTTPPGIIALIPAHKSVEVSRSSPVSCTFSEKVDRRSVESSLFVSPRPQKPIEFGWKGNQVTLRWADRLDSETTYVISIGTTVKDLRNNRIEEPLQWTFSTGKQLDSGMVSGKLINNNEIPKEGEVWAYRIFEPDTLSPTRSFPQFKTNSDKKGFFSLSYLKRGYYRVFGIIDQNHNGLYDIGTDEIAIPSQDVQASAATRTRRTILRPTGSAHVLRQA